MKVNGYEVGGKPTSGEMRVYARVKDFLRREWVANWVANCEERLTQDEFEHLEHLFETADFGEEECGFLDYAYGHIIKKRSGR